jgi:predicted ribosomally synthesized peptide with SipW-like signal peptide
MNQSYKKQAVYMRRTAMADMFTVESIPARALEAKVSEAPTRPPYFLFTVIMLVASIALSQTSTTSAYFSDLEQSTGNTFAAGSLFFTLAGTPGDETLGAGDSTAFTYTPTPGTGSLPFAYTVTASSTGGDPVLCGALTATVSAPPFIYIGLLTALTSGPQIDLTPAVITVGLPGNATGFADGAICNLDIVYSAWQTNGAPGTQYHDVQRVPLTIHASVAAPVAPIVQLLDTPPPPDVPLETILVATDTPPVE